MSQGMLNISSGPHVRDRWTTRFIMSVVALSLVPTAIVGVVVNGLHALFVILASVITCVVSEWVFDKIAHKKNTVNDCSAVVTGMLLGLTLSPTVPLYIPIIGAIFAIVVVKCCFGGIGRNFLNPALAARCFLLISFGRVMTSYATDAATGATPVANLLAGRAVNVTRMFFGLDGGVIGSSIIAIAIGGLLLWAMDIIHGEIWFSVLAGFSVFIMLFGGQGFDLKFLLAHLCGGGVMLGAFYMATDYTTSPVSRKGQMVYGLLIGVLGGAFRLFGSSSDSFSYSIIIINLLTPLIDMYIIPKPYAYRREAIAIRNGEARPSRSFSIPRPVVALSVIALLAGLSLSGVYSMTKETIEEQRRAANTASFKAVCPDAESFTTTDTLKETLAELDGTEYGTAFGRVYIRDAVIGVDASGNTVGYVVSVTSAEGNDGDITLSLGLKPDGTIIGIAFTELNETPGMGMRCGDPEFTDQFVGKNVKKLTMVKGGGGTSEDSIDGISGATITSDATVDAVNAGLDFFWNHLKEGE